MAEGSDQRWQGQGFPYISTPLVDERGQITRPWLQLLIGLWTHTSGANYALLSGIAFGNLEDEGAGGTSGGGGGTSTEALAFGDTQDNLLGQIHDLAAMVAMALDPESNASDSAPPAPQLLPLVTGELPGPYLIADPSGQTIGVPLT